MAKKKNPKAAPAGAVEPGESRAAVALTVAWMLTTLSCAAAQLVALGMWLLARSTGIPVGQPNALYTVSSVLMLVAAITGMLAIGLISVVYRVRRARPPAAITIGSLVIGLVPMITIAASALLNL